MSLDKSPVRSAARVADRRGRRPTTRSSWRQRRRQEEDGPVADRPNRGSASGRRREIESVPTSLQLTLAPWQRSLAALAGFERPPLRLSLRVGCGANMNAKAANMKAKAGKKLEPSASARKPQPPDVGRRWFMWILGGLTIGPAVGAKFGEAASSLVIEGGKSLLEEAARDWRTAIGRPIPLEFARILFPHPSALKW